MYFRQKIVLLGFYLFLCFTSYPNTFWEVQKGDTLFSISKKNKIPVDIILKCNDIPNPDQIKIGTKIILPRVYTIREGDTLYKVSREFNISVEEICKYNSINDSTNIKIGTMLIIPADPGNKEAVPTVDPVPADILWPHPGEREILDDILKKVAIRGNPGDKIIAVTPGRVIWAFPFRGFGQVVAVKNQDKHIYVYAGNEKLLVQVGDRITQGMEIAILGRNAHEGIARAYFFISKDGKAINPDFRSGI